MPYLTQEGKDNIDNQGGVDIYDKFASMELKDFAGAVNYLNFRIVREYIKKNGKRYFTCAVIVGTLICCVLEIYRRIVANYEEECIKKNGDVE